MVLALTWIKKLQPSMFWAFLCLILHQISLILILHQVQISQILHQI